MRTLLFLFLAALLQQPAAPEPLIKGTFNTFTTDELGNIYTVARDQMVLYRPNGEAWMRNSIKTIGNIHTVDAFYSMKPLVYSQDLQQFAILDNTLSVQGDLVWLNRIGYPQVSLVAASVQNNYWFYDQLDMELIRVDRQWQPLAETGRLDQLLGRTIEPTQLVEYENMLYMLDPKAGIFVFDLFGTYVKTIPVTGTNEIEVRRNAIYFVREGQAQFYNMRTLRITTLPLPHTPILQARMENGHILYRTAVGIFSHLPKAQ